MKAREALLLAPLLAVALFSHCWWITHFHEPPEEDHAFHLAWAASFHQVMVTPGPIGEKLVTLWSWPGIYPQGVYLVTALCHPLLGGGSNAGLLSLSFFIVLLILSAYSLGKQAGGPLLGAAAAWLAAADPLVLLTERRYWLDLPLAAMIMASLAALAHCRNFRHRGWSIVLGASLGFGFLVKFSLSYFLDVPLLYVFVAGLYQERPPRRQVMTLLAVLCGVLALWKLLAAYSMAQGVYLQNFDTLVCPSSWGLMVAWMTLQAAWWATSRWQLSPGIYRNLSACLWWSSLVAGPWVLINQVFLKQRWFSNAVDIPAHLQHMDHQLLVAFQNVPLPLWLLALPGLGATVLKKNRSWFMPTLLAYAFGLAATLVLLNASLRYLCPFGPLLAVLAVAWVPPNQRVKYAVLALSIGYGALNFLGLWAQVTLGLRGATMNWLSDWSGRNVADSMSSGHVDYEPAADAILSRVPPDARMLYLVQTDDSKRSSMEYLYFALLAASSEAGRTLGLGLVTPRLVEGADPHFRVQLLDTLAAPRSQMLARWQGLDARRLAYPPLNIEPPQAVVMPAEVPDATLLAQEIFGPVYLPALRWDERVQLLLRQ